MREARKEHRTKPLGQGSRYATGRSHGKGRWPHITLGSRSITPQAINQSQNPDTQYFEHKTPRKFPQGPEARGLHMLKLNSPEYHI
jgi:hypothetical protein